MQLRQSLSDGTIVLMFLAIVAGTIFIGLNPPPQPYVQIVDCNANAIDEIHNPDGTTICYYPDRSPEVLYR